MTLEELVVKIDADTKDLDQGMRQTQTVIKNTTRTIDSASTQLRTNLKGALQEIQTPLGNVGGLMQQLAGPAGVIAAVGGFTLLAKKTSDWADDLLKLADATGLNVETLQRFRLAEQQVGAESGTLVELTQELLKQLGQGPGAIGDMETATGELGVAFRDAGGNMRSTEELMPELITALANVKTAEDRARIGTQLFGEEFVTQQGNVVQFGDALEDVSEKDVISRKQLEQLAGFSRELRGVVVQIGSTIVGVLTKIETFMQEARLAFQRDFLIPTLRDLQGILGAVQRINDSVKEGFQRGTLLPFLQDLASTLPGGSEAQRLIDAYIGKLNEGLPEFAQAGEDAGLEWLTAYIAQLEKGLPDIQEAVTPKIEPPVVSKPTVEPGAAQAAKDAGKEMGESVAEGYSEAIQQMAADTAAALREAARMVGEFKPIGFTTFGPKELGAERQRQQAAAAEQMASDIERGGQLALGALRTLSSDFLTIGEKITATISNLGSTIGSLFGPIGGAIGGIIGGIVDFVGGLFGPSETAKRNDQIRESIGTTLNELQVLGQIPEGINEALIQGVGVKLKDLGLSMGTATQAVIDNLAAVVEAFQAGATQQELVDLVLEKIKADLEETEEGINEAGKDLADALSNLPTGFKVALARFNATIAEPRLQPGGPIANGFAAPTEVVPMQTTNLYLQPGSIVVQGDVEGEELIVRLEKAAAERSVRGGTVVFARTKGGTI